MTFPRLFLLSALNLLVLFGCRKDSSEEAKGLNESDLQGVWRLTEVRRVVDETPGPSSAPVEKTLESQKVAESESRYLFIAPRTFNFMSFKGVSQPCDLDRAWRADQRNLVLQENNRCFSSLIQVIHQDKDVIELRGTELNPALGEGKYHLQTFRRTNLVEVRLSMKDLGLTEATYPAAYRFYLRDSNDSNKSAIGTNSAQDERANMLFYPRSDNKKVTLKQIKFANLEKSGSHIGFNIVGGNRVESVADNERYCSVYMYAGGGSNVPLAYPVVDVNASRTPSYVTNEAEMRIVTVVSFKDTQSSASGNLTCYSERGAKQFSLKDVDSIVKSLVTLEL